MSIRLKGINATGYIKFGNTTGGGGSGSIIDNILNSPSYAEDTGPGVTLGVAPGIPSAIITEDSGTTWTEIPLPSTEQWSDVAYGDGNFVISTTNADFAIVIPSDGSNVYTVTLPYGDWTNVFYTTGTFTITDTGNGLTLTSTDAGFSWTTPSSVSVIKIVEDITLYDVADPNTGSPPWTWPSTVEFLANSIVEISFVNRYLSATVNVSVDLSYTTTMESRMNMIANAIATEIGGTVDSRPDMYGWVTYTPTDALDTGWEPAFTVDGFGNEVITTAGGYIYYSDGPYTISGPGGNFYYFQHWIE